jgi:hypothetical protein
MGLDLVADGNGIATWSSDERVPTMDDDKYAKISYSMNIIDFSNLTLPLNKKRGSEKIEIFIKK